MQSVMKTSNKIWIAFAALYRLRVIKTTSQIGQHLVFLTAADYQGAMSMCTTIL